jgi:hypothetical protein
MTVSNAAESARRSSAERSTRIGEAGIAALGDARERSE